MTQVSTRRHDQQMVPKILVQAMFGLMFATLALVSFATFTGREPIAQVQQTAVEVTRQITLTGDRTGVYVVHDLDGNQLAVSSENKAGFIGVIGRVFDRERQLQAMTSDAPVTVLRRESGNVAVVDETTGLSVELIGYGVDNVAAFARLLD